MCTYMYAYKNEGKMKKLCTKINNIIASDNKKARNPLLSL